MHRPLAAALSLYALASTACGEDASASGPSQNPPVGGDETAATSFSGSTGENETTVESEGTTGEPQPAQECSVPSDAYATIADALADSNCLEIALETGRFLEALTISRDVTIRGEGAADTSLVAPPNSGVVRIDAGANVRIESLTIRDGLAAEGAGIWNAGNLELSIVRVAGNRSESGSPRGLGLYNLRGQVRIEESTFEDNTFTSDIDAPPDAPVIGQGGAIYSEGGDIELVHSLFSNNGFEVAGASVAAQGGAIATANAALILEDCTITSNYAISRQLDGESAQSFGGALWIDGGSAALLGATDVVQNSAIAFGNAQIGAGGGGLYTRNASLTVEPTVVFADNVAQAEAQDSAAGELQARGGGVYLLFDGAAPIKSPVTLRGVIRNNLAGATQLGGVPGTTLAEGGGLMVEQRNPSQAAAILLEQLSLDSNESLVQDPSGQPDPASRGGGLATLASDASQLLLSMHRCTLLDNVTRSTGSAFGAGLMALATEGATATIDVANVTIASNTTEPGLLGFGTGGGMFATSWAKVDGTGTLDIRMSNVTLTQNVAISAGGAFASAGGARTVLSHSILWGNRAARGAQCAAQPDAVTLPQPNIIEDATDCISDESLEFLTDDPQMSPRDGDGVAAVYRIPSWGGAYDTGSKAGCVAPDQKSFLSTDQLGQPRPSGARCDLGALEAQEI